MPESIRNKQVVADDWQVLRPSVEAPLEEIPSGPVLVPLENWLERHAELPELRDGVERTRLRRVLEQQEPDERHLLLVVLVDDRVTRHVPDRDAQHAIALFAVGLVALL